MKTAHRLSILIKKISSSIVSVDKVDTIYLHPSEVRYDFNAVDDYFKWFKYKQKQLNFFSEI